ncbi:MAG: hypothetical protein ABSA83_04680, partial [Verrucomicrobiota bacterium]
ASQPKKASGPPNISILKALLFSSNSYPFFASVSHEKPRISSFSNVTLKLLEHEKRRSSAQSLHTLIDDTVELLQPYLEVRETVIERNYVDGDPKIWCAKAAFEAVLTNLLTNSLQAFFRMLTVTISAAQSRCC